MDSRGDWCLNSLHLLCCLIGYICNVTNQSSWHRSSYCLPRPEVKWTHCGCCVRPFEITFKFIEYTVLFAEYLEVVRDSLATVGEDCNLAISSAQRQLQVLLQQESGWRIIDEKFRYVCSVIIFCYMLLLSVKLILRVP